MIDLRSDTVTQPSEPMREAMAAATVGDDVYGEDPTVRELEARTAELLGKEDAVFVPTGTMSNQIGIRVHTRSGDLVLIEEAAHALRNEGGGAASFAGVTMRALPSDHGVFGAEEVDQAVGSTHRFMPTTLGPPPRLLCVENTHNAGGGTVWTLAELARVCSAGRRHGLALHLDGARLWHATAAAGVEERDFAEPFDTVNVCFSKGLGAPVGSALAGSAATMRSARRYKQQMGGGFRQAGVLAAAVLHALEHHRPRLGDDVRRARALADGLAATEGVVLDPERVHSNIVRFELAEADAGDFAERCHEQGVHMIPGGRRALRAVLHRDVDDTGVARALDVVRAVLPQTVAAG